MEQQGYRVSALTLGTQTGTHIDAPAHFDSSGKCLEELLLKELIGSYFLLDLPNKMNADQAKACCVSFTNETILFVRSDLSGESFLTTEVLEILLALPPLVWVVDGAIKITNASPLEFHRLLAVRGKYLVENLDSNQAGKVNPGGELIVLPLALEGTSGAPCRVVVRQC